MRRWVIVTLMKLANDTSRKFNFGMSKVIDGRLSTPSPRRSFRGFRDFRLLISQMEPARQLRVATAQFVVNKEALKQAPALCRFRVTPSPAATIYDRRRRDWRQSHSRRNCVPSHSRRPPFVGASMTKCRPISDATASGRRKSLALFSRRKDRKVSSMMTFIWQRSGAAMDGSA